jgi:hypothetical protein
MPRSLIWKTGNPITKDWEYDWIHYLFSNGEELEFYENISYVVEDAIIVISVNNLCTSYLDKYESLKMPFWLVVLSDEFLKVPSFGTQYHMCRHIFRNYYYPNGHPRITPIGLGYKTGFWNQYQGITVDKITNRPHLWSFVGTPTQHPDRHMALSTFKELEPNYIYFTTNFNSQNALSVEDYRDTMLQSKFVLCPMGNANLDTFRLYETLEAGAIPIVLSYSGIQPHKPSYWNFMFHKPPPFIHFESWEKCKSIVQSMNEEQIEELRIECWNFWNEYKLQLKDKIQTILQS